MCSLFERVTIFCVILGMKQTVNTRRESGICQFPPLFYFRVSQPLRNLFSPFFSSFKFSLNRVQIYIYITQFFKPLWNCILKKNQLETKSHYSLPVKKNRFRNTTYYHVSAQHQDLGSRHKPPPPSLPSPWNISQRRKLKKLEIEIPSDDSTKGASNTSKVSVT